MIDITKPMQTRNGKKVIAYHLFDINHNYPLVCFLEDENSYTTYTRDGKYSIKGQSDYDLINVPESPLTPFGEAVKLLNDLADLQNGAPLEQHRKEWEETMQRVYEFLNTHNKE